MWLALAFASALLLGFYDVFKKQSLSANAVIPVLLLNTLISSIIFLPFIVLSAKGVIPAGSIFHTQTYGLDGHLRIMLKAVIVLSSWLFGYFAIKHLPLTIAGPINATRPVIVLLGALTIFAERLTPFQWLGVLTAIFGLFLLSRSGKKEGIRFAHNKWIACIVCSNLLGAISALYDRYLLAPAEQGGAGMDKMAVQSWFNIYQLALMTIILLALWMPTRRRTTPFVWRKTIPLISIFLAAADFLYFYALTQPDALISVVSMIRRGSVIVSFLFGALAYHEKNLRAKALDLCLVILSMIFLYIGSK